jgi:PAS domain S-box-containing protein
MATYVAEATMKITPGAKKSELIRVLHVDDDSGFLQVSKEILELRGLFEVHNASSVEEAFENISQEEYDAIVSDYKMPGKDGLEFLKELRAKGNITPFVIFTGKGREEVAINALNLGADGYYNKQGSPETVYGELAHGISSTVSRRKTEEALRVSEENYSELFNGLNDTVYVVDFDANFVAVNAVAVKVTGYSREELLSMGPSDIDKNLSKEQIRDIVRRMPTDKVQVFETGHTTKDGTIISVEISSSLVTYQGKQAVLSVARDITERKKVEEKLKESEEKYKTTFESSMDALMLLDERGFFSCNRSTLLLFGCKSVEEFAKYHPADLSPPKQPDGLPSTQAAMNHIDRAFKTGTDSFFWIHRRVNGTIFSAEVLLTRIPLKDQNVLQATVRDITERKKAEEMLRLSEKNFSQALHGSSSSFAISTLANGRFIDVNDSFLRYAGYSREEVIGRTVFELNLWADPEQDKRLRMLLQKHGSARTFLSTYRRKNGEIGFGVISAVIIEIEGKPCVLTETLDITERKKAEEALKRSEVRFRDLTESICDVFFAMDNDLRYTYWNRASEQLTGFSAKDTIGKSLTEVFPDVKDTEIERFYRNVLRTKQHQTFVNKYQVKEKDAIFEIDAYPTKDGISVFTKDITKIKLAEMELQVAADLFDAASDSILVHDLEGKIVYFNEAAHKLKGYSRDEFQKLKVTDLEAPGNTWDFGSRMRVLLDKGEGTFETFYLLKNNAIVPFEIHARIIESHVRKLVLCVARDISERKKAEEKLKQNLYRIDIMNEKLRVVGSLTRHDARNKLTNIVGNVHLARKKLTSESDALSYLNRIESTVDQITGIFDFAGAYERIGLEKLVYVDVEKAVKEVISFFPDLQSVEIKIDCHGLTVLADSLLNKLFFNLIDNSLKHGKQTNQIRIYYQKENGGDLRLVYEDDGVGIPYAEKPKLFKEGYSTSGSTGYGLHLIKKLTEVYGWTIQETGEPCKGAQFTITIPQKNQNHEESYNFLAHNGKNTRLTGGQL